MRNLRAERRAAPLACVVQHRWPGAQYVKHFLRSSEASRGMRKSKVWKIEAHNGVLRFGAKSIAGLGIALSSSRGLR